MIAKKTSYIDFNRMFIFKKFFINKYVVKK